MAIHQHAFGLAAGLRADHVDLLGLRQQFRAEPVEARRGGRPLHAEFGQLGDVMLDRGLIAPGPAGNRQTVHFDDLGTARAATVYNVERQLLHHTTPVKICIKYYCDISQASSV
ncbi:hypothetical protein GGD41_000712 [Paraburkholderia bryophila]|uniref:Uncharacterized protein n=1 Tax=Paraburkholderia bryophila TaxID=420952 RepID=A0A7Y9W3C8_9BURK|nr:hypothetical protein [Paraburkholderia bryophila]